MRRIITFKVKEYAPSLERVEKLRAALEVCIQCQEKYIRVCREEDVERLRKVVKMPCNEEFFFLVLIYDYSDGEDSKKLDNKKIQQIYVGTARFIQEHADLIIESGVYKKLDTKQSIEKLFTTTGVGYSTNFKGDMNISVRSSSILANKVQALLSNYHYEFDDKDVEWVKKQLRITQNTVIHKN